MQWYLNCLSALSDEETGGILEFFPATTFGWYSLLKTINFLAILVVDNIAIVKIVERNFRGERTVFFLLTGR